MSMRLKIILAILIGIILLPLGIIINIPLEVKIAGIVFLAWFGIVLYWSYGPEPEGD